MGRHESDCRFRRYWQTSINQRGIFLEYMKRVQFIEKINLSKADNFIESFREINGNNKNDFFCFHLSIPNNAQK